MRSLEFWKNSPDFPFSIMPKKQTEPTKRQINALTKEIRALLIRLKRGIADDYRATEEDTIPSMLVTFGIEWNREEGFSWSYQTGDNSFSGGAYGFKQWGLAYLYRKSNCSEIAKDAVNEALEQMDFGD
jgi:hypothetical protein